MRPSEDNRLLEIVKATGEIYGKQVSLPAAVMFLGDLEGYSSNQITTALAKCRKELRTFPTVADVTSRIDDGRPGVEEAWAMLPKSEEESVVWTQEMSHAFSIASSLIDDDRIAARMAFKEAYQQAVAENRAKGIIANWTVSLGHDKSGRDAALRDAVLKNRLAIEHVQRIMPEFQLEQPKRVQIAGPGEMPISGLIGSIFKDMPKADA